MKPHKVGTILLAASGIVAVFFVMFLIVPDAIQKMRNMFNPNPSFDVVAKSTSTTATSTPTTTTSTCIPEKVCNVDGDCDPGEVCVNNCCQPGSGSGTTTTTTSTPTTDTTETPPPPVCANPPCDGDDDDDTVSCVGPACIVDDDVEPPVDDDCVGPLCDGDDDVVDDISDSDVAFGDDEYIGNVALSCVNLIGCGDEIIKSLCESCQGKFKAGEGPLIIYDVRAKLVRRDDNLSDLHIMWRTNKPATSQSTFARGVKIKKYTNKTSFNGSLDSSHKVIVPDQPNAQTYHFKVYSRTKTEKAKSVDFMVQTLREYDTLWEMMVNVLTTPWKEIT